MKLRRALLLTSAAALVLLSLLWMNDTLLPIRVDESEKSSQITASIPPKPEKPRTSAAFDFEMINPFSYPSPRRLVWDPVCKGEDSESVPSSCSRCSLVSPGQEYLVDLVSICSRC